MRCGLLVLEFAFDAISSHQTSVFIFSSILTPKSIGKGNVQGVNNFRGGQVLPILPM